MAVFVSPRVKTELDDIWLHIATESVSIDIASRLSSQSPIISFSYRSIRTWAGGGTTYARACGV
jgi:hypothetical protein